MFKRKKKPTLEELREQLTSICQNRNTLAKKLVELEKECKTKDAEAETLRIKYCNALFDYNSHGGIEKYQIESSTRKAYAIALAAFSSTKQDYSITLVRFKKAEKLYKKLTKQINKLEKN